MKRVSLLCIILLGLLFGGWAVKGAFGPEKNAAFLNIRPSANCCNLASANCCNLAQRLQFADRTETEEQVTYGSGPQNEHAMDERIREEKEKEDKAWKMLQNEERRRRPPKNAHPAISEGGSTK